MLHHTPPPKKKKKIIGTSAVFSQKKSHRRDVLSKDWMVFALKPTDGSTILH